MCAARNIVIGQNVSPTMWQTAKRLRQKMTPDEKLIWQHLRGKQMLGLHFRRQQIIRQYVVDFYCHAADLVVELDGATHARQIEQDRERDGVLSACGLRVLRFKNEQVRADLSAVLKEIADACKSRVGQNDETPGHT